MAFEFAERARVDESHRTQFRFGDEAVITPACEATAGARVLTETADL